MKPIAMLGAAAIVAGTLLPAAAQAQANSDWQFQLALYGYFPTLSGTTVFPGTGASNSVSVDPSSLIDGLEFVFMGTFEARKGDWGGLVDAMYLNLGGSKSQTRDLTIGGVALPVGAAGSATLDMKGTIWTFAGTYRALQSPDYTLDLLGGARLLDVKQTLDWQLSGNIGSIPLPGQGGSREVSVSQWDGIVGLKGRVLLGDDRRWVVPYYLDVGTGESQLTWQAVLGLGYSFSWGDIVGAWRYLDYNMKSGTPIQDLSFNGPLLAVTFRW